MNSALSARLAALYVPAASDMARPLPEIGERLQAQLSELQRDLTPERAERMAVELEGVRRLCLRIRATLLELEGGGDGQ